MTYTPATNSQAVDLELGEQYYAPTNPLALNFDLNDQGGEPEPELRTPPLSSTNAHRSDQHSKTLRPIDAPQQIANANAIDAGRREHNQNQATPCAVLNSLQSWDEVATKDGVGREFQSNNAEPLSLLSNQELWQRPPVLDEIHEKGAQAWDIQPAKDQSTPQRFNDPADHNVTDTAGFADSIMNWQPETIEVEEEIDGTLNLQFAPYTPPGAAVVDFELVPQTILVTTEPPTRSVDAQPASPGWSLKTALDGRAIHPWDRKPRLNTEVDFPSAAEPDLPIGEPPAEPIIKRTYIIMNSSSLVVLPSNTPLEFSDLSIGLDVDSFAWVMSCSILNRSSMDKIRPTSEGPAEVIATINGYEWRFVIERYQQDKRFAKEQYKVNGVSRSQLLASPYAPKRTGRIETQNNVVQIMTEQLQYTGFTVNHQAGLSDYVIPADAWGYDNKTALEVIAELATAQGAVVVPDRELDVLHIKHRYKQIGPWTYDDLLISDIDAVITDAMVQSYASQWEPNPEYNSVFVSGITDGVSIEVVRWGTAGDNPATDIFDDLNVEAYQCKERGLTAIASSGNQEIVSIDIILPTGGSPGLIEPGMLIEYRDTIDSNNTWRGNVLSNNISVSKPGTGRVVQSIKVERHYYA